MTAARLVDTGYRRYEGERLGPRSAQVSVYREAVRRSLGIGRPARAKVFPVLAIAIAYIPTAVYVGVAVIGRRLERGEFGGARIAGSLIPTYASNYPQILLAVVVVAAFVGPEVLCPDRRTGMLGLYLAGPLRRSSYLLAKVGAVLTVLAMVTLGPPIVLLVGYTTQGYGPDGLAGWLGTLGRIVAAGSVVAVTYGLVGLALASTTTRKGAASAFFLALVVGSSALTNYLVVEADLSSSLALLDLAALPYELVFRIFGEPSQLGAAGLSSLPTASVAAAVAAWVLGAVALLLARYRTVEVTR